MAVKVRTMLGYLPWVLPLALIYLWSFDRVRAYFFQSEVETLQGFISEVLPANYSKQIVEGLRNAAVHAFYTDRWTNIRLHVGLGASIVVLMSFTLLFTIRDKDAAIHRFLGWTTYGFLTVFALEILYTMCIRGMSNLGAPLFWADVVALTGIILGLPSGYLSIRAKYVPGHRLWMTFVAASIMLNPAQRFLWPHFAKSNWFSGVETWDAFLAGPTNASVYTALVAVYGVWAWLTYTHFRGLPAEVKAD